MSGLAGLWAMGAVFALLFGLFLTINPAAADKAFAVMGLCMLMAILVEQRAGNKAIAEEVHKLGAGRRAKAAVQDRTQGLNLPPR